MRVHTPIKHSSTPFSNYCVHNEWNWEPQAPQMPYVNNLDLMVFPAMSKRHSALLSNHSNTVAKMDVIYRTALDVWNSLDGATIASGFILAYRICRKVIKENGNNSFLSGGDYHSFVRLDYNYVGDSIVPTKRYADELGLKQTKASKKRKHST